jgi:hypothetical protein
VDTSIILTQVNTFNAPTIIAPSIITITTNGTTTDFCTGEFVSYTHLTYYTTYITLVNWTEYATAVQPAFDRGSASAISYFKSMVGINGFDTNTSTCTLNPDGEAQAKIGVTVLTSTSMVYLTSSSKSTGPTPAPANGVTLPGASPTPPPVPPPAPTSNPGTANGAQPNTAQRPPPAPTTITLTLGKATITATLSSSEGALVVNGQTLPSPGAAATLSAGVIASYGSSGLAIAASGTTTTLPNAVLPAPTQGLQIGGQILTSGGNVVVSGTTYSLLPSGSIVEIGGGTTKTSKLSIGTGAAKGTGKGISSNAEGGYGNGRTVVSLVVALSIILLVWDG